MSSTIEIPDALFAAVHKEALVRKTALEDLVVEWLSERLNDDKEAQTGWLTALKTEAEAFARLKPGLMLECAGQYVAIYGAKSLAAVKMSLPYCGISISNMAPFLVALIAWTIFRYGKFVSLHCGKPAHDFLQH